MISRRCIRLVGKTPHGRVKTSVAKLKPKLMGDA